MSVGGTLNTVKCKLYAVQAFRLKAFIKRDAWQIRKRKRGKNVQDNATNNKWFQFSCGWSPQVALTLRKPSLA